MTTNMTYVPFFNDSNWSELYPLGFDHQLGSLRVGGFTLAEAWAQAAFEFVTHSEQTSRAKVHFALENGAFNDRWVPNSAAFERLIQLQPGEPLKCGQTTLFRWNPAHQSLQPQSIDPIDVEFVHRITDLFSHASRWIFAQERALAQAWNLTNGETWQAPEHVLCLGPKDRLWVHPDAQLLACTLNTHDGPICIGPRVEIQEGAHLRGPLVIAEGSVIKMGSRISGATSIGPECRIGGEVSNCAFAGFSNKGHDGFLGQSVIGKWCNLGADTNSSNLKSNYSNVRIWSASEEAFLDSGLQFCGLLMGDHSKCGINTMFNTGTTVGEGCNIFGGGFQPKYIPDFSWGGGANWELHAFDKFIETSHRVMSRRNQHLDDQAKVRWKKCHDEAAAKFAAPRN